MSAQDPNLPDATFKLKAPLANFSTGAGYPAFKPLDTKGDTWKVFRTGFYTVTGAYVIMYMWRRSTFNIVRPLAVVTSLSIITGVHHSLANIREKNDSWNSFWGGVASSITLYQVFERGLPFRKQLFGTLAAASAIGILDRALASQRTSSAGQDFSYKTKKETEAEPVKHKQGFWEVWQRRPL
ncbi:uncharacterized protein SPAPADRAFT_58011, partial [Spathaspora passalidarum NRRL Y-27907]